MREIEITCEVYEEIEKIKNTLLEQKFKFVEKFTLDDIYMYNKENNDFYIKDGKISDTLIIRVVNGKNKKIICKKRNYNNEGLEISTDKTSLIVQDIEESENFLNTLGYERYLRMIDTNYMYENDMYIAYIQEVEGLGIFLEIESKVINDEVDTIKKLIDYVKSFNLKIGNKFDIRKAEKLYEKEEVYKKGKIK